MSFVRPIRDGKDYAQCRKVSRTMSSAMFLGLNLLCASLVSLVSLLNLPRHTPDILRDILCGLAVQDNQVMTRLPAKMTARRSPLKCDALNGIRTHETLIRGHAVDHPYPKVLEALDTVHHH
ncbi:hypothetical protein E3J38_06405 [candidate division TA06 bacterium]|uniref:Uncharacterized protein n=1 Tax=candidate division TA06 bacterium TaxID=2250710 RepID=A0A523XL58_UNCT6|nr:MAG: hypothetical protein E3J38_06405 [candidate division TA06 bacterium]